MQSIYSTIGKNIHNKRKERHMTQEFLAAKIETSAQYVSRIERGQVCSSLEFLYKLADALDCSIYELLPSAETSNRKFFSQEVEYQINHCSKWKQQMILSYIEWFIQQPDPKNEGKV